VFGETKRVTQLPHPSICLRVATFIRNRSGWWSNLLLAFATWSMFSVCHQRVDDRCLLYRVCASI